MTKATDTKSTARTAHQDKQSTGNAFFNKEGSDSFFGEKEAAPKPFFVQRKLTVGEPNDHFEKQADRVADKVVQRMSKPAPAIAAAKPEGLQLKEKEDEVPATEEKIQRKPIFDSMGDPPDDAIQRKSDAKSDAPSGIESRLKSTKGSGAPLPADTKTAMESSIGADFSGVRVHTGSEAAALSNDLQAQAFTHGNDIYFNEGKFDATSSSGRHLLAHELTHTVQQGAAVQKKADESISNSSENAGIRKKAADIQRDPVAAPAATASSGEVVNISSGSFNPSANLLEEIRATKNKGLDVNITAGKVAGSGTIKVREKDGVLESLKNAYLPLNMPMFSAANPTLAVRLANGQVSGFGTIGQSNAPDAIPAWLKKNGTALAWLTGIDVESITSKATNTFENGVFTFTINGVKVKVGGFADATMDLGFENMQPTGHVVADMDIKGMVQGNLDITLKDNQMSGEGSFAVEYKSFAGNIEAKFQEGVLDVKGTVSYSGDKLSGSITLLMTDKATADNFAKAQLGGEKPEDAAMPEAVPAAEGKGPRGMAGMGNLTFNLTEWFAGSVNVIVDGKGFVTVVGKIAPPKEIVLFEQKDYSKELFKMEARAAYGIPVLGNVFVFANMALIAMAKVGPAKIYNIEVNGTYSNNPDIAKEISLSGSLNMSAYAGLRLRAEGGAGIELAGHDLKVGVGVNADAGVKGYVDARPTIGYRDPGEFFFKGHMEIAAQPFLGLSGDLFVELDSPWWSPLPDKKWTWPIGALEYPLPGEFGIGADMEYVLGSGKVPEVTFSEAKFDGAKFMTDLVDDHVPQKGGGDKKDKQGKFVDGGAAKAPAGKESAPAAGGKGAAPPVKGGAKGKGKGKDKGKDKEGAKPDEIKNFSEAMKKLKQLEGHKPMTREEITSAVEGIKKQYKIPTISFKAKGKDQWLVSGSIAGKPNKQSVKVKAKMKPGDDKDKKGQDKEKEKQVAAAVNMLKTKDKGAAGDGVTREEADNVAKTVHQKYSAVLESISVIDVKDHWNYGYVQKKPKPAVVIGGKKPAVIKYPPEFKVKGYLKAGKKTLRITSIDAKADTVETYEVVNQKKGKTYKNASKELKNGTIKVFELKVPTNRYLPSSWKPGSTSVRPWLYTGMHGFATKRKNFALHPTKGKAALIAKIMAVKNSKAKLPVRQAQWQQLRKQEIVNDSPPMSKYAPNSVKFDLDHKVSVGEDWSSKGGNNTSDAKRREVAIGDKNLRFITSTLNKKKSGDYYEPFVGPGFTSKLAEGGKSKALTITRGATGKAQPFLKSEGGEPIV